MVEKTETPAEKEEASSGGEAELEEKAEEIEEAGK